MTNEDDLITPYNHQQDDGSFVGEYGLTKREYFAAVALGSLLRNPRIRVAATPSFSVRLADQLISELNKSHEIKG